MPSWVAEKENVYGVTKAHKYRRQLGLFNDESESIENGSILGKVNISYIGKVEDKLLEIATSMSVLLHFEHVFHKCLTV